MGFGDRRNSRGIHGLDTGHARHPALAPSLRERVRVGIESVRFERAITMLIVANALTLGLETSPSVAARVGDWLHVIDRTVLGVFAVELLLRFFVRSYWIPGSYAPTLSERRDSFLRLLKNNDFKEESMTKVGLDALGTSTTLESNKSPT